MKKELLIIVIIFLILSVIMHYDQWLLNPLLQISNLENSGVYGLGYYHPLIFTFLIYIMLLIPRGIFKLFK